MVIPQLAFALLGRNQSTRAQSEDISIFGSVLLTLTPFFVFDFHATSLSFNSSWGVKNHGFSCYVSYILTPPVNLNPLSGITQIPYAVNSKNLSGGLIYSYHF